MTKFHYTIPIKIFKSLTLIFLVYKVLRKENLKCSYIHNVHETFFDIPDELNTLVKEFVHIIPYRYDHPGFRELCFEKI